MPELSGDHNAPKALGPYRLERRLGAGGMGEVFLALDERLDRRVALKRLRPDRPGERKRLRREARALARLHHPSIVQCFDILARDEEQWLVMEYVEGPRLVDLIAEGPLPIVQVVEYGRQVAEGLQVAHGNGLVHRDLKAENVVIDRSTDRAKILDFGLVRTLEGHGLDSESLTASGAVLGTLRSVSPEQAMGLHVGPQTDLFSLGVLLYEMITGASPYRADSPTATLGRVLGGAPDPLPPDVPDALARLIFRLLEKAPENRPRDAAGVARQLGWVESTLYDRGAVASEPRKRGSGGSFSEEFEETTRQAAEPSAPPPSARVARIALGAMGASGILIATVMLGLGLLTDAEPPQESAVVSGELDHGPEATSSKPPTPESDALLSARSGWEALEAYGEEGRIDHAIEIFRARIEAASGAAGTGSANDHAGLARAYWRKFYASSSDPMWLEQATSVGRLAVELAENENEEARARTSLGLVQIEKGEIQAARGELERALAIDPTNFDAHRGLAEVYQAGRQYEAAEASIRRALEIRPDDHELFDHLGSLHFRLARYDEAESAFRRSVELAPELTVGYRNLAGVHIARGEMAEAAAVLERALEIRPTSLLHLNLGTVYFFQGLYSRAADAYEQALDSAYGVHEPVAWANLGDAYRQIPQRRSEAPRVFRQAIRLLESRWDEGGTQADGWQLSQLALYRSKAGLTEEARETLDGFEVDDPRSLLRVATAWEILGERGKALESLAAAFEAGLDPDEVRRDPELVALRSDRRFHELLGL